MIFRARLNAKIKINTTISLLLLFFYFKGPNCCECPWASKQETFSRARIYPRDGCDFCDAGAVIFKNQWLACMLRAKCGCGSDATVATVGFTLVLVGAVVLAKNFEGRAKRLAPSRRGTVLRGCLGGAPFEGNLAFAAWSPNNLPRFHVAPTCWDGDQSALPNENFGQVNHSLPVADGVGAAVTDFPRVGCQVLPADPHILSPLSSLSFFVRLLPQYPLSYLEVLV